MLFIFFVNILLMAITVMIHHEMLYWLSCQIPNMKRGHRFNMLLSVSGAILAHVAEVWVFALAYYYLTNHEGWGSLQGNFDGSLMDCIYFSFTNYTTLGYGDIEPLGAIRFVTGIEALMGLVLITWTASFLFEQVRQNWRDEN